MKNEISNLFKAGSIFGFVTALEKLSNKIEQFFGASFEAQQVQNLFNVALKRGTNEVINLNSVMQDSETTYQSALKFQKDLAHNIGLNSVETSKFQATYSAMLDTMGLTDDISRKTSRNLTRVGLDLSSLYGISGSDAMERLRAGMSGQAKPLRTLGIDISETTLTNVKNKLGIETSVRDMNQANKALLRYIAISEQAQIASGNLAKTINQPAQQFRIFRNQIELLKRSFANLFMGLLAKILPVANAILMTINAIIEAIGNFLGIDVSTSVTGMSTINDDLYDVEDSLDGATAKAKEFKKQLMGFDEIHNIDLPDQTASGGGGIGGSLGGIDQKLLDSLKDYDEGLQKIKSTANDIRDKLLDWFGITYDTETGTYKISNWFKFIFATLSAIVGLGIIKKFTGFILGGWVDKLKTSLFGAKKGADALSSSATAGTNALEGTSKAGSTLGATLKKVGVVALAVADALMLAEVIKGLKESNEYAKALYQTSYDNLNVFEKINASGVAIGETVNKDIESLTGFNIVDDLTRKVVTFANSLAGTDIQYEKLTIDYMRWDNQRKADLQATTEQIEKTRGYIKALEGLIDADGKVTKGKEEQAKVILNDLANATGQEISLTDNVITLNGEAVSSYADLNNVIQDNIEQRKLQAKLESNTSAYHKAVEDKITAEQGLAKAIEDVHNATTDKERKEAYTRAKEYKNTIDHLTYLEQTYSDEMERTQIDLNNTLTASLVERGIATEQQLKKIFDTNRENWIEAYNEGDEYSRSLMLKMTSNVEELTPDLIEQWKIASQSVGDEFIQALGQMEDSQASSILNMIAQTEELTPNVVQGYLDLSLRGSEAFNQGLSNLPVDTQAQILSSCAMADDVEKDFIERMSELGVNGDDAYNKALENLDDSTRLQIESATEMAKNGTLTSEQIQAWADLARNDADTFNKKISELPSNVKDQILLATGTINNGTLTEAQKEAWRSLANADNDAFNKSLKALPESARNNVIDTLGVVQGQNGNFYMAGHDNAYELNRGMEEEGNQSGDIGNNILDGFFGAIRERLLDAWNIGKKLMSRFFGGAENEADSHSPSKRAYKLGIFVYQGYSNAIKENINNMANLGKDLVKGLNSGLSDTNILRSSLQNINDELMSNANMKLDYATLSSNIQTSASVNVTGDIFNQLQQASYQGLLMAMQEGGINVNIEARTDDGVVLNKAVNGINDYVRRTGSLPFPVV